LLSRCFGRRCKSCTPFDAEMYTTMATTPNLSRLVCHGPGDSSSVTVKAFSGGSEPKTSGDLHTHSASLAAPIIHAQAQLNGTYVIRCHNVHLCDKQCPHSVADVKIVLGFVDAAGRVTPYLYSGSLMWDITAADLAEWFAGYKSGIRPGDLAFWLLRPALNDTLPSLEKLSYSDAIPWLHITPLRDIVTDGAQVPHGGYPVLPVLQTKRGNVLYVKVGIYIGMHCCIYPASASSNMMMRVAAASFVHRSPETMTAAGAAGTAIGEGEHVATVACIQPGGNMTYRKKYSGAGVDSPLDVKVPGAHYPGVHPMRTIHMLARQTSTSALNYTKPYMQSTSSRTTTSSSRCSRRSGTDQPFKQPYQASSVCNCPMECTGPELNQATFTKGRTMSPLHV
jgi:hypothetical protein